MDYMSLTPIMVNVMQSFFMLQYSFLLAQVKWCKWIWCEEPLHRFLIWNSLQLVIVKGNLIICFMSYFWPEMITHKKSRRYFMNLWPPFSKSTVSWLFWRCKYWTLLFSSKKFHVSVKLINFKWGKPVLIKVKNVKA